MGVPALAQETLVFGYGGQSLSHMSLAVLKVAYGKLGISVQGKKLPSARSLAFASSGQVDGEVNRIKAIEADFPSLIRVPEVVNYLEGIAVSCNKPIDTTNPENISRYSIGIKIGNVYAEKLTRGMPRVTRLPSAPQLNEMLKAQRVDLIVIDRVWATMQRDNPGNDCFILNEPPLVTIPLYHYLHKKHAALAPQIASILKEMEESGESRAIRTRILHNLILQGFDSNPPFSARAMALLSRP